MQTTDYPFEPYIHEKLSEDDMMRRSKDYLDKMRRRRSIRTFSTEEVPLPIIQNIIETAASAPSGANKQPWTFCVVRDPDIKRKIRSAAEKEERMSYDHRMSDDWLEDLKPFGTNWEKPFLEIAPYLIVVFKKSYDLIEGKKYKNYYVNESVGIACGMLIAAIHNAGLVTLTHTPSPMRFLEEILGRPENERAYLLLPVGLPAERVKVPKLEKKTLNQVFKLF